MTSESAALNIQRTWRGHHDRLVVRQKLDERERKRKEYLERANLLEALVTIQTRVRVFLARCRYNIAKRHVLQNNNNLNRTPSAEERVLMAEKAATEIQRHWKGHHDRQLVRQRAQERKKKMEARIEQANLLEAVLLLQTRARILLARARRRIRADLLRKVNLEPEKAGVAERSAVTIQRHWRGHRDRQRVRALEEERRRKREEHFDRANLLEAVLMIQTRARIFLARTRRRIYERTLARISPDRCRGIGEAEEAAVRIQKVWRGVSSRKHYSTLRDERRKQKQEYLDRVNLLESVLLIQTRVRMFRDRIRLKKLKEQRSMIRQEQQHQQQHAHSARTTSSTTTAFQPHPPSTNKTSSSSTVSGRSSPRSGVMASNNNNNNTSTATQYNLYGSPSASSSWARPSIRGTYEQEFAKSRSSPTSPNSSSPNFKNNKNKCNNAKKRSVYDQPPVSRAGFFVSSYERHVGSNVYQALLKQSSPASASASASASSSGHVVDPVNNLQQRQNHPTVEATATTASSSGVATELRDNHIRVNGPVKYASVLESFDSIKEYAQKVFLGNDDDGNEQKAPKQTALYALFDCCGSDKLSVIVEVWDQVTPFGSCKELTKNQFVRILEQLRAIKVVSDTKKKLVDAEKI